MASLKPRRGSWYARVLWYESGATRQTERQIQLRTSSKEFSSVNEYLLSLVENDLIKKKDLKKSERRSPVTSTKRS